MPVTFFTGIGWPALFIIIVLNAKPKQNDVAISKTIKVVFFILAEFSCVKVANSSIYV